MIGCEHKIFTVPQLELRPGQSPVTRTSDAVILSNSHYSDFDETAAVFTNLFSQAAGAIERRCVIGNRPFEWHMTAIIKLAWPAINKTNYTYQQRAEQSASLLAIPGSMNFAAQIALKPPETPFG